MEEPVNSLGGVMQEVAAAQRQTLARANVLAHVRSNVPVKRTFGARVARALPRMRFVFPTLAVAGAVAIWWGISVTNAPLSFAVAERPGALGQSLEAPSDRELPLRFSDGSSVAVARGARVKVTSLDARGATVQIERGRANVDVRHRGRTRWRLRAGAFQVAVTGTRFSIDWEDRSEALTVVMTEGTVEVSGGHLVGGSPITVTAGQRFHVTARASRWTLAAATLSDSASESPAEPAVAAIPTAPSPAEGLPLPTEAPPAVTPPPVRTGGSPAATASRSWQALARSGRYQEALKTVERAGFDRACVRLGADDLVQLGDAARLARNPARAEQAYRMARKRFPGVDRPVFALGLIAFEQRRDFRAAARWFDIYVRQYPNGPLAREALGRGMESWHRAGDAPRARHAARDYLADAPTGPYAPLARQIAAP